MTHSLPQQLLLACHRCQKSCCSAAKEECTKTKETFDAGSLGRQTIVGSIWDVASRRQKEKEKKQKQLQLLLQELSPAACGK